MSDELRFTVHGSIVSNNAFKAPDGEGSFRKTKRAREDARRVKEIASFAAVSQGWEIPGATSVEIIAWCSRLDADNVAKGLLDSLKEIAWRDDADVMEVKTSRRWDDDGERYEVIVRPADDLRPGRKTTARVKVPAWRAGDPIPAGFALLGDRLVSHAEAMKLIGARR
jgi:Holliday junction resolvase RusA-like endonuclease